jgi:hypothetical protein
MLGGFRGAAAEVVLRGGLVETRELPPRTIPPYFRGGVTPAGSGTCATFSVIETRL